MTREQRLLLLIRDRLRDDLDAFLDNQPTPLPNVSNEQCVLLLEKEWDRVVARRYVRLIRAIDNVLEAA